MPAFLFKKGTVQLTDIEAMDIKTENNGKQLNLWIDVRLKGGKVREVGALRLSPDELETPHPKTKRVSVIFPKKKFWERLELKDKSSINIEIVGVKVG